MQQNAFDLLRSGGIRLSQSQSQSQKPSKRRRSSAEQQSAYSTCPVCGDRSIPTWFLEQHVGGCLDKPATQSATQRHAAATNSTQRDSKASRVPAARPPLQPQNNNTAAADGLQDGGPAAAAAKRPHQPPKQTTAAAGAETAKSAATADGAVNAFAIMTAASAAQVPLEAALFLEACSDGSWLCHWWNQGAEPPKEGLTPAWSAHTDITMPKAAAAAAAGSSSSKGLADVPTGSTKLRLQLATNLPSGYGTAVDWNNPLLPSNKLDLQQQQQQQQQRDQQGQKDQNQQQQDPPRPAAAAGGISISSSERKGAATDGPGTSGRGDLSIFISALQKCIRRGRAASATRLSLLLLKEAGGPEKLLRRLSIICLEDGLLHPQLPLVVWTMMALSKGYIIGGSLANALLSITHQMAAVGHRDFLPDADAVSGPAAVIYTPPRTWQSIDAVLPPSTSESLLVKAILIRAAYGGMSGDKEMLVRFAGLWLGRFTGATQAPPSISQPTAAAAAATAAGGGCGGGASGVLRVPAAATVVHHQQQQQPGPPAETIVQQHQQQQGGVTSEPAAQPAADPAAAAAVETTAQQETAAAAATVDAPAPAAADTGQRVETQIPGRKDPASCFAGASAAVSPWLEFLRSVYQLLPRPGEVRLVTQVTSLGPLEKKDIPEAAVDFHVSNIVDHLLQQKPVQDTLQHMVNYSTVLAARIQGQEGKDFRPIVQQTLWLYRSSYNSKVWLQQLYESPVAQQQIGLQMSGYARQVVEMEVGALQRFKLDQKALRVQLNPLWKVIAVRADAFSLDVINKRVGWVA